MMSAEGVLGEGGVRSTNYYYCHQCHHNFTLNSIPNDDSSAVCPRCQMGFIEELPDPPPGGDALNSPQDLIETINVLAGRPSGGTQDGVAPMAFIGFPNFMQELTDIFANFDSARGQQIHFIQPNPGMTMHSNPGDYVFGGAGIDTVVTQIFNQPIDGVGPPPLDKELIKKIPTVKISREQVASSLQCSICWEDFILDEPVRELKCDHFFHEQCIIPWLELHGTCPVCRKFQQEESNKEEGVSPPSNQESSTPSSTDTSGGGGLWPSLTNANDLNDMFTSAIDTVLRSVEFPSSSSAASTTSTGGHSSSSNGSGEPSGSSTNNGRDSSNADVSNYYYDFDLE